ncbi:hypothetical protein BJX63DRAFT_389032 [Aspergillus granulosus]|uniref:Uncharacterized protein n=1 Tax=Aspergillus granulosus TaxID=176169 RepID=A0ABR4HKE9_9EURO
MPMPVAPSSCYSSCCWRMEQIPASVIPRDAIFCTNWPAQLATIISGPGSAAPVVGAGRGQRLGGCRWKYRAALPRAPSGTDRHGPSSYSAWRECECDKSPGQYPTAQGHAGVVRRRMDSTTGQFEPMSSERLAQSLNAFIQVLVEAGASMDQLNAAGKTPTQVRDEVTESREIIRREREAHQLRIRGRGRGRGRG